MATSTPGEFPKLLWHTDTSIEITVATPEEQAAKLREGYGLTVPTAPAVKAEPVQAPPDHDVKKEHGKDKGA